ncbi:MAG: L(+)-tartrate dehydratase subunit alpha [Saccharofermentans sp.]|nr:L(+)-tartrate dehydratase subunit alpha [Saccharofermentans sp.]
MPQDKDTVEKLSELISAFICYAAGHLPDDVRQRLDEMSKIETEGFAPQIYDCMRKNMEMADILARPSCQDTGLPQFFARVGTKYPYLDEVEASLIEAVKKATIRAPLRPNAVEVFEEYNTGNNIGSHIPWIDWELVPDSDELELYFYMAGGGCSLPGMAKVLMPLEGYEGIAKAVFDQMTTYGVNACPPCLVGIGIAGSAEVAAKLSKKALLRPVGSSNPNPKAAQMEKLIEDGLNSVGLGPGGFGGKLSCMGVNIEQASRHPATLAMGLSTACWAHRRAGIRIKPDYGYDFFTHKGVTL